MIHKTRWTDRKIGQRIDLIEPLVYRKKQPLAPFRYTTCTLEQHLYSTENHPSSYHKEACRIYLFLPPCPVRLLTSPTRF